MPHNSLKAKKQIERKISMPHRNRWFCWHNNISVQSILFYFIHSFIVWKFFIFLFSLPSKRDVLLSFSHSLFSFTVLLKVLLLLLLIINLFVLSFSTSSYSSFFYYHLVFMFRWIAHFRTVSRIRCWLLCE